MTTPAESFSLSTNAKGQLVLHRPGQDDLPEVRIRRAFPWSDPDKYVSVRNKEGKEVILIDDLARLPKDVAGTVRDAIAKATLVPRISRIVDLEHAFGFQQWKVETDRGPVEFRVQEREDVRFLNDGRFSVKDADGNIYELPREDALDAHSRKLLEFLI